MVVGEEAASGLMPPQFCVGPGGHGGTSSRWGSEEKKLVWVEER